MNHLISFFIGAISALFAETVKHKFFLLFFKLIKKIGIDSYYHILDEGPFYFHKNYNNIILLDVNEEAFSGIASKFMKEGKNSKVFITNIKQPEWFYSTFKNSVYSEAGKNETVQHSLQAFEWFVKNNSWSDADRELKEIIDLFYKGNEKAIIVFPHLRSFGNSGTEKVRISFFDLNIEDTASKKTFKENNKKWHFYFFEKFINHNNVESLYKRIDKYKGTDALILNNKIILNHDDSINELHYQRNVKSGFFYNVTNDYEEKKTKYQKTFDIWDIIYKNDSSD